MLRPPCPDCGADDVLALHASYRHRPPRALRWLTLVFPAHFTLVYTCTACYHLVCINTIRPRSHATSHPPRSAPARRRRRHRSHPPVTRILGHQFYREA